MSPMWFCHHSGMSHTKTEKSSKWWFQRTRGIEHKERDGGGQRTATDKWDSSSAQHQGQSSCKTRSLKLVCILRTLLLSPTTTKPSFTPPKMHFSIPTTVQAQSKLMSCHITNLAITLNQPSTTQQLPWRNNWRLHRNHISEHKLCITINQTDLPNKRKKKR